jgi:hypothetical protein
VPRFDRLLPVLSWTWRLLVGLLGGLILNFAYDWIFGDAPIPTAEFRLFVWNHYVWVLFAILNLIGLSGLSVWDKRRRIDERLLARATVKPVEDLRPGLRGENVDVVIADYRSDTYLERPSDIAAAQALGACAGIMVIGRPLSGKTRTAWEVMRHSPKSTVVIPRVDDPPDFRSDGLRGKNVILFIDDLHLIAPTLDLNGWMNRLENAGVRSFRLICTSRDGTDWARVEEHLRQIVHRFGPNCRVYTSRSAAKGSDVTVEEGKALAAMLNLNLADAEFARRFDGTPGSLTLDLAEMGQRYDTLSRERLDGVFGSLLINALKLLHTCGQPRLREDIARAVAETIRANQPLSNETWDVLKRRTEEEGFGIFVEGEFRTYRPYLESAECVSYEPSDEEIEALLPLLEARRDYEGLYYLGAESRETNVDLAKRAYQASADGGFGWAANNLGTILWDEGNLAGAEVALNRAIELDADLAFGNLGKLLSDHTDRAQEAENAFREGAARGIANASFGLGNHLAKQPGREADAEAAFREAIERGENGALLNLGNLLMTIPERRGEAEQLFRDAIAAGVVEAYNSLGAFLLEEGDRKGAEVVFRTGIENGVAFCSFNLAEMLMEQPNRWDDAEKNYRDAIAAGVLGSQLRLGVFLSLQPGREQAAVDELQRAVDSGEIDGDGYHRLGMSLMKLPGKENEADAALRKAIEAGDELALNTLGVLFADIEGLEDQAEVILKDAAAVAPGPGNRNLGIHLARQEGRAVDATNAFIDAIAAGEVRAFVDLCKLLLGIAGRTKDACAALKRAESLGAAGATTYLDEFCKNVEH